MSSIGNPNRPIDVDDIINACLNKNNSFIDRNHNARVLLNMVRENKSAIPNIYTDRFIAAYNNGIGEDSEFLECILQILTLQWECNKKVQLLLQSTLTLKEEETLAKEIKINNREGKTVPWFLEKALENTFTYLDMYTPEGLVELVKFLQERKDQPEGEKIYIALNIPKDLANEFHAFISHNDIKRDSKIFPKDYSMSDEAFDIMIQRYISQFNIISNLPGVRCVCVASVSDKRSHMKAVVDNVSDIYQKNPEAKIIVMNIPSLRFIAPITKVAITNSSENSQPSLPKMIAKENPDSECTVLKVLGKRSGWSTNQDTEAVADFCDRHRVHRSFGIETHRSILGEKKHHKDSQEPMKLTHDGVIVCIGGDDNDAIIAVSDPNPGEYKPSPAPSPPNFSLIA